ncbi:DUF3307 domain-containing protein [Serratia marcescens]|nr:DUF3307 domain-containing protein [Serratia marcescens]RTG52788.1 DUF3307 domain-containing protein [Serratia marcescens]
MDLTYAPLLAWLLLVHLLADFPLQPLSWVEDKIQHRARSRFLLLHALLHGVLAAWVVAGFGLLHGGLSSLQVLASLLAIAVSHYLIDLLKVTAMNRLSPARSFLLDQGLHLAVIALLWLGLTPLQSTLLTVLAVIALLTLASRHLLRESGADDGGPMFVLPRGWVMFIGILCFIMFLAEGSMLDWSALFLTTLRGVEHSQAGLGYALFSITMTLGRLNGDRVVNSLGRYRVLLLGSLCAALGLSLAIAFNHATVSLVGFMLVGLGASNVVPILFSAAGNQRDMPANLAIASVTTVGYAGILAGPALIGFVAQFSSLTVAFACVAALLLAVAASARAVTR